MLVLDRKVKEGFWIEGGIFVKVLDIGRRRVKLGIEAPDNIKIMREELAPRRNGDASVTEPSEEQAEDAEAEEAPEGSLRSAERRTS